MTKKMSADHQFLLVDLPVGPGSSDVDSSNLSLVISVVSFCSSSLHIVLLSAYFGLDVLVL